MTGDRPPREGPARLGRRAFLGSAALSSAALGAAALAGCTEDGSGGPGPGRRVAFNGDHQPGIDTPAAHFGLLAAFNLVSQDRARLARSLRDLTDEARGADRGPSPGAARQRLPAGRDRHAVARRADRRPFLANDRLDPAQTHGDLRRGFNFSRGFDNAGRLDRGLAFVSYQKSLARGFLAVQARLKGEPLEEYILPVGGGFFFALPGVSSDDAWLGQELLD